MGTSVRFICELSTGLHARPASLLAEAARGLNARATITNDATGERADIASVLSVLALDVQQGHETIVDVEGDDAERLLDRVRVLIAKRFNEPAGRAPVPESENKSTATRSEPKIPRALIRAHAAIITGITASPGFGEGIVVRSAGGILPDESRFPSSAPDTDQLAKLRNAMQIAVAEIEHAIHAAKGSTARDILTAHREIMSDPALVRRIENAIASGHGAPRAIVIAAREFMAKLHGSASVYVRARAVDVQEVARRLIAAIDPTLIADRPIELTSPSIIVAHSLDVRQLSTLDRANVRALVMGDVGATSHVVILARSMGIPTLIGVRDTSRLAAGSRAIVDADAGFAVHDPSPPVRAYYARERRIHERHARHIAPLLSRPGGTRDGTPLRIGANAAGIDEISGAMSRGAEGIGLLRTELLFLDRADAPSEDEQFALYGRAAEVVRDAGKSESEVVIRTLDIGGDKPASYVDLPHEENPFLGCRGIRVHERHPELLRTQLRAICRASACGPIEVMTPMIATVREAKWFVEQVRNAQRELEHEGIAFDKAMPVGIMIEVPSIAMAIDQLVGGLDFISLGTNDLCQYFFAADRMNPATTHLNDPCEPSFLRLLDRIVREARSNSLAVSICGEMASDLDLLPIMVGLAAHGLDTISIGASAIPSLKARLSSLDATHCVSVLEQAKNATSAAAVRELLQTSRHQDSAALSPLDTSLVQIDCDAATKDEAIQELVGLLHVAGRTTDPRAIEDAIWTREETYATGLGFGLAIPHCRTDAVPATSIAIARFRAPIEWGSSDGEPVSMAIMLVVPSGAGDQAHLKLLARLARRLMHEAFRDSLKQATDPDALLSILERELELKRA